MTRRRGVVSLEGGSSLEERPLCGKSVVVTRAAEDAAGLSDLLTARGARVVVFPTIARERPRSFAPLDRALSELSTFAWVAFTSVPAVEVFFERLGRLGLDARALSRTAVACVGAETSRALLRHGLRSDLVPRDANADALAAALTKHVAGRKVLLPRASEGRDVLPSALAEAGAEVVSVTAYRTVTPPRPPRRRLQEVEASHVFTFTAPSTVRGFVEILGPRRALRALRRGIVAAIGSATTSALQDLGVPPAVVATRASMAGLVEALEDHLDKPRGDS